MLLMETKPSHAVVQQCVPVALPALPSDVGAYVPDPYLPEAQVAGWARTSGSGLWVGDPVPEGILIPPVEFALGTALL